MDLTSHPLLATFTESQVKEVLRQDVRKRTMKMNDPLLQLMPSKSFERGEEWILQVGGIFIRPKHV